MELRRQTSAATPLAVLSHHWGSARSILPLSAQMVDHAMGIVRVTRCIFLFFAVMASPANSKTCEDWCSESCSELNGDVTFECGACDAASNARCYPGAPGYGPPGQQREQGIQRTPPPDDEVSKAMRLEPWCNSLRCQRVREKRVAEARQRQREVAAGALGETAEIIQ